MTAAAVVAVAADAAPEKLEVGAEEERVAFGLVFQLSLCFEKEEKCYKTQLKRGIKKVLTWGILRRWGSALAVSGGPLQIKLNLK